MSGNVQIELWLNAYKAEALSTVLERQGTSIEEQMQNSLNGLYLEVVPQETQRTIQVRIDAEQAVRDAGQETDRKYTCFRVVENGAKSHFQSGGKITLLHVGKFLWRYLLARQKPAAAALQSDLAGLEPITAKQYDRLAKLRTEAPQMVPGMFVLDFDRQEISATDAFGVCKTYSMEDVSDAVTDTYRKSCLSTEQYALRFLGKLAGHEITSATPKKTNARTRKGGEAR